MLTSNWTTSQFQKIVWSFCYQVINFELLKFESGFNFLIDPIKVNNLYLQSFQFSKR